jgi:DNA polymerase III subunit delta
MNVRPDQLHAVISEQLHPIYLVTGDEPLQVMEAADLIRKTAREQDFAEREVMHVDSNFDWQTLKDEAGSLSLFSSRRILDLRLPSVKPGRDGGQMLKEYAASPPQDTLLLITGGKLESAQKSSAWFKALDKVGVVMQCWPVGLDRLPAWVTQRCHSRGLKPQSDVVDYICQRVEGNMLAAAQEIEKLLLLLGPGVVDMNGVREAVADSSRYTVFELADSALAGERPRVIRILHGLRAEGIEPILITWALAKDLRLLAGVSRQPESAGFALQQAGVWTNRQDLFRDCLRRHSVGSFNRLLQQCARIDAITKGVQPGDVWDELLSLGNSLAA